MNPLNLPLPKDTREVVGGELQGIDNFGLLFNRYVSAWSHEWEMKEEEKKKFLVTVLKSSGPQGVNKAVAALNGRQKALIQALNGAGWSVERFDLTLESRFITGLGATSVLETGMALHPLYGFPYLPASGLKGLARAFAEVEGENGRPEFKEIFGSEDKDPRNAKSNRQGKAVFLDGLPHKFPALELDIMNPHYPDYYQAKKDQRNESVPPGDFLSPVPITFLAVASGETFSFGICARESGLVVLAKEWLIGGLTKLGAGGKTNVGYGYFGTREKSSPTGRTLGPPHRSESSRDPSPPSRVTKPEPVIWHGVSVRYHPGNQTLTTSHGNEKAETRIGTDRSIVAEALHKKLFERKDLVKADVTVELIGGNRFNILKVEPPRPKAAQ